MVDINSSGRSLVVPVVIDTELGTVALDVFAGAAPITAANFLGYVDAGFYDGGVFHRVVRLDNQPDSEVLIEVVQGGRGPDEPRDGLHPIKLERTTLTGLHHHDGTVSMARFLPDSALSDFFICLGPQPELDFGGRRNPDGQGFAAFGEVTAGMDIVHAIHESPFEAQRLAPPIRIHHIHRVD